MHHLRPKLFFFGFTLFFAQYFSTNSRSAITLLIPNRALLTLDYKMLAADLVAIAVAEPQRETYLQAERASLVHCNNLR